MQMGLVSEGLGGTMHILGTTGFCSELTENVSVVGFGALCSPGVEVTTASAASLRMPPNVPTGET